jgi:uncharacterized protein
VACSTTGQATDVTPTLATVAPTSTSSPTTTTTAVTATTVASTTTEASTTTAASTTTTVDVDTGDLVGWETAAIDVGGQGLTVAVADDPGERAQGLMGVEHLGDLDGMLFVFSSESLGGFWMKGTLIPLDIVFFDEDRTFVDMLSMVPCTADPCPSYVPEAPFSWALETPAGTLSSLAEGTILSLEG